MRERDPCGMPDGAVASGKSDGCQVRHGDATELDPGPVLHGMIAALRRGAAPADLAAAFHDAVAHVSLEVCTSLRRTRGLDEVALSGGVFQNARLLRATMAELTDAGFRVMAHRRVPPNDGGLALGQAAIATLGRSPDEAR